MKLCTVDKQAVLGIAMVVGSIFSTVFLIIALASDHLVSCFEKQSTDLTRDNATYLQTDFGLWRACSWLTDKEGVKVTSVLDLSCKTLKWRNGNIHPNGVKGMNEQITNSIVSHPLLKVVFALMLLGLCMQLAGHVTFVIHRHFPKKNFCMFSTGGSYVFSGLSLLAATILFMSKVTEESLHQKELAKGIIPQFRYSYGTSFMVLAASFILIEVSGILAVYIFIVRYKKAYKKKHTQRRNCKSQSALWQNVLNRTNDQFVDHKCSNVISTSAQRLEVGKTTPQDSSPSALLKMKKKQEYVKIVNSVSAHSKLADSNGCTNHAVSVEQNNSVYSGELPMTSNGTGWESIKSHGGEELRVLCNEPGKGIAIFVPNGFEDVTERMELEVVPPPPTFNYHPTCIRKVTTTV